MEGYDVFLEALKWIALVFMAGFVGYFGKYLGIKIIARFAKDEGTKAGKPEKDEVAVLGGQQREEKDKLREKQDKEQLKQAKKLNKTKSKQQKKQS